MRAIPVKHGISLDTTPRKILLTIDVEDWFQVENLRTCLPHTTWASCETRVEGNTRRLLDVMDSAGRVISGNGCGLSGQRPQAPVKGTFFVLGWVAERMPGLIREIHHRGHEVASHGYRHQMCRSLSTAALCRDLADSRKLLEDIIGAPVNGYRAPSFSIDANTLRVVAECGYRYDSSWNSFALSRRYGRLDLPGNEGGIACRISDGFFELPVSNTRIAGCTLPTGGGGYFRLFPYRLFREAVRRRLKTTDAHLLYLHPWEIDPGQPRVNGLSWFARFRHYVNLHETLPRLSRLLRDLGDCKFVTCTDYLKGSVTQTSGARFSKRMADDSPSGRGRTP